MEKIWDHKGNAQRKMNGLTLKAPTASFSLEAQPDGKHWVIVASFAKAQPEAAKLLRDIGVRVYEPKAKAEKAEKAAKAPKAPKAEKAPKAPKANGEAKATRKGDMVVDMLREGASIAEIMEATGWANHTVRGFMSRDVRKNMNVEIDCEKVEGRGNVFTIAA